MAQREIEQNKIEGKSLASIKQSQIESEDELDLYKALRKKRKKKAIYRTVVWALLILLAPLFIFSFLVIINPKETHNFFGYKLYVVTSGSMQPVFSKGDCIVVKSVKSAAQLRVGEDIAFISNNDGKIVTHRIIEILTDEYGNVSYVTKGVHNVVADTSAVSFSNVVGKRVAVLQFTGRVITFFRTPWGIVTFLIIMVTTIFAFIVVFKHSEDIRAVGKNEV